MHSEISIVIRADQDAIFQIVSDLQNWPRILPHYRWIDVLESEGNTCVVNMAARRGWIPIQWTSRYWTDADRHELHFEHLKAFTRGMKVVWTMTTTPGGVRVCIRHDLEIGWPVIGNFVAERIIGKFFIHHVASQTLAVFKRHLEAMSLDPGSPRRASTSSPSQGT